MTKLRYLKPYGNPVEVMLCGYYITNNGKLKFLTGRPFQNIFIKTVRVNEENFLPEDVKAFVKYAGEDSLLYERATILGEVRYAMHRAAESLRPSRKKVEA